jgi:hypothetical protein
VKKLLVLMLLATLSLPGYGCAALKVAHQAWIGGTVISKLIIPNPRKAQIASELDNSVTELAPQPD